MHRESSLVLGILVRSTVFYGTYILLSTKNVRDGVRHALRHGVVSLKSSFFVGLIIIGRLNNTIILLISLTTAVVEGLQCSFDSEAPGKNLALHLALSMLQMFFNLTKEWVK
jgi:hypothetical protein